MAVHVRPPDPKAVFIVNYDKKSRRKHFSAVEGESAFSSSPAINVSDLSLSFFEIPLERSIPVERREQNRTGAYGAAVESCSLMSMLIMNSK